MFKILLADTSLNTMVHNELASYHVDIASSKEDFYTLTYENTYDLYLINYYYFNVLEELKKSGDKTVSIFVDEYYNIQNLKNALSIGDDYMIKPMHPEELKARIAYQYKKLYNITQGIIRYKDMFFHLNLKHLYKNSQKIKLSPSETKLAELLLTHRDKPLPKALIYEKLETTSEGTLRVYISKLNKIGFDITYERSTLSYNLKD